MVHEQVAGFALDALDPEESIEFERHLVLCPDCEEALEPLRVAAAALAFAGDLPRPRPELRERVLRVEGVLLPFRRRRMAPLVSAAAAVAAACVAVVFGIRESSGGSIAAPLGEAQAFPVHGAKGALVVAPNGEAVLLVQRLAAAPAGRAYEVWIIRRGHPAPAGILHGSIVELNTTVPHGARVAVTLEPAAGSLRPTGPFLLQAERA